MSYEAPGPEPTRRQWVGFWSMIVQQTQNAFNDKMAQFTLIPLGGAVGYAVESQAGLMIALPFVLFAPIAGWLSDRYSKRTVIFGSAVLQLIVLLWICGAVYLKNLPLALAGFFGLAVQSAFFSPAKFGINKELVGSNHLGFASGIQQMTAMLAILVGQIIAGWIFDHRYHALGAKSEFAWQAALFPLLILTALAVPALFLAWIIPRVPAQGASQKFSAKLAVSHFASLSDLWRDVPLRRASFGVAFFWGFAAFINLWSVKLAKLITGGGDGFGTLSSTYMAAASLGMAGGFGFASFLLRRRIELGWVPVAGVAMTLFATVITFIPLQGWHFLTALGLLAFAGAVFLAPLNAWMQDRYPADKRGDLQSAVNLQDCFAGIIAVALIAGFEISCQVLRVDPLVGFRVQMGFIAIACAAATWFIIRLLPADFVRVIGISLVRTIYKIRVVHSQRLPKKGGVLLLPNHVTYIDAFLISAACDRPVRFVMDEAFIANRSIRIFTSLFETVTIRRDQPLEAIREIIRSLKNGDLVCFFPEGQLTRTGSLSTLQRGFELIARKAGHPLIPMWCDGSWGSIFSFEGNRFFRKRPHRMPHGLTFAFGKEIEPSGARIEGVRHGIHVASCDAIARIFSRKSWTSRKLHARNPASRNFASLDPESRRRMWINGHQIGLVNGLLRRQAFHVLAHDPLLLELPGLFAAFPELCKSPLRIEQTFNGDANGQWVGSDLLRTAIQTSQVTAEISFYDFSSKQLKPVERAGLGHYPCLAVEGVVIAMSMPHPQEPKDSFEPQHGHKLHSLGKLLPGWHIARPDGDGAPLHAYGPAAPPQGLALPANCVIDAEAFLICEPKTRGIPPRRF
jgi:acyl-[acyl-carrier-protein]-phospholipid O-acyltransferase / long-chain-fatty-acid--[acyl-carrier-protein] ligase